MKTRTHPNPTAQFERHARRGLTLLELLIVMAICGVMLGIGLGAFTSLNFGAKAAVSEVQTTLRSANNWAIARQASAHVRIDPVKSTMTAEGAIAIGTWHFEQLPVLGAFDLGGVSQGAVLDPEGWQGNGVSFLRGGSQARVVVPVENDSAYDLSGGFAITIHVRRDEAGDGQVLSLGGEVITLKVDAAGRAIAGFQTTIRDEMGVERNGGREVLRSQPGVVPLDTWIQLRLDYDRRFFKISRDGLVVAQSEQEAEVAQIEAPLEFGGGANPFPGSIDSCSISAIGAEHIAELPEEVLFSPESAKVISFAPGGGLDRSLHLEPASVKLLFDDGTSRTITINLYGTVEG